MHRSSPHPHRYPAFDAFCLPIAATGFSLVFATLASASYMGNGNFRKLLQSDDYYIGGFAVAILASCCFATASGFGWWFRSRQVAFIASAALVLLLSATMIASDTLHNFGEADQIVGAWGFGVAIGGSFGLLAFAIRRRYYLIVAAASLFFVYGCFYLHALSQMGRPYNGG